MTQLRARRHPRRPSPRSSPRPRPSPRRYVRRALVAGGLAALVLFGPLAGPAAAHATLIGTNPVDDTLVDRAPEEVELRFDEPVEAVEGGIRVIDPQGERADRGQVDTDDDMVLRVPMDAAGEGTYTVAWRVVSGDSHNLSGSFVFHVGVRTGSADLDEDRDTLVDAVGGIGRWAGFAGAFVVVGAGVLAAVPATASPTLVRRRLLRLVLVAAGIGAAGVALSLVSQTARASGRSLVDAIGFTPDVALDTRTGVLAVIRLAALLVAALLAAVPPTRRLPLLAVAAGVVSLVCASLSGHAWTAPSKALAVPVDVAHLVSVAVWLGGLVGLALVLRRADDPPRLVGWFSAVALVSVAVVALTGTISGVVQVKALEGLASTGYGQLLMVKVAGFGVLVLFGFYHRQLVLPHVERLVARLGRSLPAEIGVAVAVLAVTAVLINQPPARDQVGGGLVDVTAAADEGTAKVQATVDPAKAGSNDIHLYFSDGTGAELVVTAVEMTAAVRDIPPRKLDITPITPSHVSALDASLSSGGLWTLQVTAVTATAETVTFTLEVPVR